MPSAEFQKAVKESRQLKAKPGNDELLEVSPFDTSRVRGFGLFCGRVRFTREDLGERRS